MPYEINVVAVKAGEAGMMTPATPETKEPGKGPVKSDVSDVTDDAVKSARSGNDGILYLRKGEVVLKRNPKETAVMVRKIADLMEQGQTTEQAAKTLGIGLAAARYYRTKGMRIGIIPRARSLRSDAKKAKVYKRGPYKKALQPPPAPELPKVKKSSEEVFGITVDPTDGSLEVRLKVGRDQAAKLLVALAPFL